MLYYEAVAPNLITLLKELLSLNELDLFRLAGGTSLALQIGHRKSIDLDLFTDKIFDKRRLQRFLSEKFSSFTVIWESNDGFTSFISEVKVDFFNWHIPFLFPSINEDGLRLVDKREIAAMKMEAITGRKERKDFIDIAFLLKEYSLKELLVFFKSRYPFIAHTFALESLMAIDKADESIIPEMVTPSDWKNIKEIITNTVRQYFLEQNQEIKKQQQERLRKAEELLKNKKDNPKND
jgi:hypothetical protein